MPYDAVGSPAARASLDRGVPGRTEGAAVPRSRRPRRSGCTGSWTPPVCSRRRPAGWTPGPEIWPDEVRIRVETLNLDAASYRQLATEHTAGTATAVRDEVLAIVAERGKMQNPVTGSGGMLMGTVEEVGPQSPLGLAPASAWPRSCRCR